MIASWWCSCLPQQRQEDEARKSEESIPRVAFEKYSYYKTRKSKEMAPLFQNWEAYYDHLPIRKVDNLQPLKLCDCAFWVNDEDLEAMAHRLEKLPSKARASVVYLTAPSCSGKTASVLPAFLKSAKSQRQRRFTHYLYLAFANNGENRVKAANRSVISETDEDIAMCQGAEFMLTCMTGMLLLKRDPAYEVTATSKVGMTDSEMDELDIFKPIDIDLFPRGEGEIRAELKELLDRCFVGTLDHPRLLVHVDEHQKMTRSSEESRSVKKFADFRRGAMQLLADEPRIKCVVTYTELLSILPPDVSSAVCREPCQMPVFDIWKFDNEEKKLGLDRYKKKVKGNLDVQRMWATLLFRLSAKFGDEGVLRDYHVCKISGVGMDNHFVSIFKNKSDECGFDVKTLLSMEELKVHGLGEPGEEVSLSYSEALKLTAGIKEKSYKMEEKLHIGVTLARNVIVGDWLALMSFKFQREESSPGRVGYMMARSAFRRCVLSAQNQDIFSSSPLESAFAWCLFALSADREWLQFGESFGCTFGAVHYKKARLFFKSAYKGCMVHPNSLTKNTIYRALEGEDVRATMPTRHLRPLDSNGDKLIASHKTFRYKSKSSHPLCDIFFVTNDNCLVLIDVTAASNVDTKAKSLGSWTAKYSELETDESNESNYSCQGVVLAPFCSSVSNVVHGVNCVCGEDARRLLGALDQIFRWFDPQQKVESDR